MIDVLPRRSSWIAVFAALAASMLSLAVPAEEVQPTDPAAAPAPAAPPEWLAPRIEALEAALADHRALARAGEWPVVVTGDSIEPGDSHPVVPKLRARLALTGEYAPGEAAPTEDPQLYEPALVAAVERFQAHHGLEVDGIVGPRTRAALNASPERRIAEIEATLQRMRTLSPPVGRRYVIVNIPSFTLHYVEGPAEPFRTRVIVGARRTPSPEVTSAIERIVFNPYWTIPRSIARNEMLPRIRKDVSYLTERDIRVYSGWGSDARQVNPYAVDWEAAARNGMPYMLRQDPGPENALGRIKFLFPNPYSVYLHDTPSRTLFEKADRALSHGCIRVQRPLELAERLLAHEPDWSGDVEAVVATGENREYRLAEPVPIRIVYWTAWVDDAGAVRFAEDLYERACRGTPEEPEAPCACSG